MRTYSQPAIILGLMLIPCLSIQARELPVDERSQSASTTIPRCFYPVDASKPIIEKISGPKTFELFLINTENLKAAERLSNKPVMVLTIDENKTARLVSPSVVGEQNKRRLTLSEAEKVWGKAFERKGQISTFKMTTSENKTVRIYVVTDKNNYLTDFRVTIDGIGGTYGSFEK